MVSWNVQLAHEIISLLFAVDSAGNLVKFVISPKFPGSGLCQIRFNINTKSLKHTSAPRLFAT